MARDPLILKTLLLLLALSGMGVSSAATGQEKEVRTVYHIKYLAEGAVYLDGGTADGLAHGHRFTVRRKNPDSDGSEIEIAELKAVVVATASTVCEVVSSSREIVQGDSAYLRFEDADMLRAVRDSKEARRYPQVISFSEGDPLDEEARALVPRPPLPEVNRARGRIGIEYNTIRTPADSGLGSSQLGLLLRADITRIGGSYWNFTGHYRGRLSSRDGGGQQTLTDLINRTYQLSLTYDNPGSRFAIGLGRLYLPWATSLSTIDGGYFAVRSRKRLTVGVFAGSAPDPTSWNYDPQRQIGGIFENIGLGSFESFRFTSTIGVALSRIHWQADRQFGFMENTLFYKRHLSIYHNLEADLLRDSGAGGNNGLALSRNYLTLRVQPVHFLAVDVSHNYFRDIPTFDTRLVGTGLVDRLLFQGLSAGLRLELPYRIRPYLSLGRSSKTGDLRPSWNKMFGITLARVWRTGVQVDARYTQFDSSFGRGSYRALSLTREVGERMRFAIQGGEQILFSPYSNQGRARWLSLDSDWFISRHYIAGAGLTVYRGDTQEYNQFYLNFGYRF